MLKKWSVLALSIAAATSQMAYAVDEADSKNIDDENLPVVELSSQAKSNGFIEDADLTLLNRNFAFYRNFNHGRTGVGPNGENGQNYSNEWAHAFLLDFTSGFTKGTVGFGVDAFGYQGIQLNSGPGTGGTGLLPADGSRPSNVQVFNDDGELVPASYQGQSEYGKAGGAIKARISETVLKYGDQRPESPVFATGDSRLLPSAAKGTTIYSDEIEGLALQGGHFTSGSGSSSTNSDGELSTVYGGTDFRIANYIGGDYTVNDNLGFGIHAAEYQNVWNQYYADLYHTFQISEDVALSTSLNYYKTEDTGNQLAGSIDTNAYSGALALSVGAQTFTVGHQKINGNTPFDYVNIGGADGNSIWLGNASQFSDFNAPGEASWRARYDLDLGAFGVPGLSFMVSYVKGDNADGTKADPDGAYDGAFGKGGNEWERDIELMYVVQEGPAKDLSFRIRQATWRASDSYSDAPGEVSGIDEVRLITEYPLDIL